MYTLSMRRRRALDIQTVHQQEGRCESGELTAQTAHACSLSYACEVKVSRWRCLLRLLKSPTARLSSARMLHSPLRSFGSACAPCGWHRLARSQLFSFCVVVVVVEVTGLNNRHNENPPRARTRHTPAGHAHATPNSR